MVPNLQMLFSDGLLLIPLSSVGFFWRRVRWPALPKTKTRLVVLFVAATLGAPAWADDARFDGDKAAAAYYEFRGACRIRELDDQPITPAQAAHHCAALDALGFQLKANGWCWNQDEAEWMAPNTGTDTGIRCPPRK